jgi:hypothetical protein
MNGVNGAQDHEVDEPKARPSKVFMGSEVQATLVLESEAYPEPKYLTPAQLKALKTKYGSCRNVARLIGVCKEFVRRASKS